MRLKVCLAGLIFMLVFAGVITGCGHKSTSHVKKDARVSAKKDARPAKANNQPATGTQTADQPGSTSNFTAPDSSNSGLPLNNGSSALERALNPLAQGNMPSGGQLFGTPAASPNSAVGSAAPSAKMVIPKDGKLKPEQVLSLLQMRYRSAKSLQTAGQSSIITKADGKVVRKASGLKSDMSFKRPDKLFVSDSNEQLITNGKTLVKYGVREKRYVKIKLDKKKEQEFFQGLIASQQGVRSLGLLLGIDYTGAMSSFKLKESSIGSRPMYVLSMKLKEGVGCPKGMNITQTLWIGKKDFAIYRNYMVAKGKPTLPKGYKGKAPKYIETTMETNADKCQFDANIPDSKFAFNPPSGAKPADELGKNYLENKPAPDFSFTWIDGEKKTLSDFRGKAILLDCWALPMCEKHLPTLQKIYEKYGHSVQVVSICLNKPDKIKEYLEKKSLSFPVVYANQSIIETLQSDYHIQGIPTIYIIDKSGVVRNMMLGMPEAKDIEAKLAKID